MSGVPAVLARGGSSRGLIIKESDLAGVSEGDRGRLFARWVGSPDPTARQVDGVGGGNATTSKVAVLAPSRTSDWDVDYHFFQVDVASGVAECRGTCGNLTTAVGQFAVDEGMVDAVEPITTVRLYDVNTSRRIDVDVPVSGGGVQYDGELIVDGVPGSGAPVVTRFLRPGGAVSGRLLPTGSPTDDLEIGGSKLSVTVIDVVNPVALVHGATVGLDPEVPPASLEADTALMQRLEDVRRWAAVQCDLASSPEAAAAESPLLPFVGMVLPPTDYHTVGGEAVAADQVDAVVRMLSGGAVHRALPLGAGLATAAMARLGLGWEADRPLGEPIRLGHPSGVLRAGVTLDGYSAEPAVSEVSVTMTGRRIMSGVLEPV